MMCTIVVSLLLQISSDRPAVLKQYSYSNPKKAEEFAAYYRKVMDKDGTPPRITDVQLLKTNEFNCDNFTRGEE